MTFNSLIHSDFKIDNEYFMEMSLKSSKSWSGLRVTGEINCPTSLMVFSPVSRTLKMAGLVVLLETCSARHQIDGLPEQRRRRNLRSWLTDTSIHTAWMKGEREWEKWCWRDRGTQVPVSQLQSFSWCSVLTRKTCSRFSPACSSSATDWLTDRQTSLCDLWVMPRNCGSMCGLCPKEWVGWIPSEYSLLRLMSFRNKSCNSRHQPPCSPGL